MKKSVFILLSILILLLAGTYIFIPGEIRLYHSLTVEANKEAMFRKIGNIKTWKEWWPGETNNTSTEFISNDIRFQPGHPRTVSVPLTAVHPRFSSSFELTFIPRHTDSTTITAEMVIPSSSNPFKRIGVYFASKKAEKSLLAILDALREYCTISNLYGYDIQKKLVVDSILVFTSEQLKERPSNDKIYSLVDKLKAYVQSQSAKETGHPMLNIYTADSTHYLVKVAIPVDRKLPDSGSISYKWMLGGGNILITEVKGGPEEVKKAYGQVLHYIADYGRLSPAIPYESLVTDRRKERDSTKWVTRIYYPVM